MKKPKTCLIIGAGMAGLMAAQTLQTAGVAVTLLDKGRGVGGRMATRRVLVEGKKAVFDHGAQFFTVRDARFQQFVERWLADGVVEVWTRGFQEGDGHPRYRGRDGMTAVAKAMAHSLTVHTQCQVTQITRCAAGWQVTTTTGELFQAHWLIMTPPVPQSLALLNDGGVTLPDEVQVALKQIRYDPCFSVMAVLSGPSGIPVPGAVQGLPEPLFWISDNKQKGISGETAVTIHAGPHFSQQHFDRERDEVAQMILKAAKSWLNGQDVLTYQVQRWRYSMPTQLHSERYLLVQGAYPLAFAGDAFKEPRVEGAALSGLAAAEALLSY